MASIPYMPFYISDYMADAAHLSTVEHGAYLLLIMTYWQKGDAYRANDERTLNERLARVVRMSNEEWMQIRPTIAEFFQVTDTEWGHRRIETELAKFRDKSDKAKAAGIASAKRRLNGRSTDVQRTFNHTDTDTEKDKEEKKTSAPDGAVVPLPKVEMPPGLNVSAWEQWIEYRKKLRKPLKQISISAAQQELAAFGDDQLAVVTHSIANGYQGLFAPKNPAPAKPALKVKEFPR